MEKEERNPPRVVKAPVETEEFLLQWGSRKRLRCVRVRGTNPPQVSSSSRIRRRITSRLFTLSQKNSSFPQPTSRYSRNSEVVTLRSESRKSSSGSLEKEERYYATRGSTIGGGSKENGKITVDGGAGNQVGDEENLHHHHLHKNINSSNFSNGKKVVWPKICIALSSKEKEEDFLSMKGSKLPQRPKKRAKLIQRTLLLVSPGAWLTDMSWERYEVREKRSCRKKARGLKAMGSIESDSE